jgi:hypothetical protein
LRRRTRRRRYQQRRSQNARTHAYAPNQGALCGMGRFLAKCQLFHGQVFCGQAL